MAVTQEGNAHSVSLDTADREGAALLREALRVASYDLSHIGPMLRSDSESATPRIEDVPIIERLLPKGAPLSTLVRLFLLGRTVSDADATVAFGPLSIEHAVALGVIRRADDGVRSQVRLLPTGDLVLACDRTPDAAPDLPADHVVGVGSASRFLAGLTVRRPVRAALDLGTGCGIQAILAARHATQVVACDINPRALNFTAFNALLNGVTNVACRRGSFFEPVRGETFDLIVSNPPFVISPESAMVYRDSGLRGDDVSRQVITQASTHLAEGGLAFILIGWGVREGETWPDRLREWASDLPCDVWFLHHSSEVPLLYAASWNSPLQSRSDEFATAIDRWTAYLADLGFAQVAYGAAVMRRRTAQKNWVRFDDLRGLDVPESGEQIARLIAAQDYIAERNPARLLETRLVREPQHRLDQILRARDGTFAVEGAALRLLTGLRFSTPLDGFGAELFAHLDGTMTVADAARSAAEIHGDGARDAEVLAQATNIARRLLAFGLLRLPDA